jgi:hypothetical protein
MTNAAMNHNDSGRIVASLLATAAALEDARTGPEVRMTVRDGLLGLEYHLDTLARELARGPESDGPFEPAFRRRAETVEATLRSLLVAAWGMLMLTDEELAKADRARTLAHDLRRAAHEDIALVFDRLFAPQALD